MQHLSFLEKDIRDFIQSQSGIDKENDVFSQIMKEFKRQR